MKRLYWLSQCLAVLGVLTLTACTGSVSQKQDSLAQSLILSEREQCAAGRCPCESPIGTVVDGAKVPIYDIKEVSCTDSCQAHARVATCQNGKFSEDISKAIFACNVVECKSCVVESNVIPHGNSAEFYSTAMVDCNESCEAVKVVRTCRNGILSGDSKFSSLTCENRTCSCPLPDGSGTLTLGGQLTLYSAKQGTCDKKCVSLSQSRKCVSNGTGDKRTFAFDGNASFKYDTCSDKNESECGCKLPNTLGTLATGATFTLSQVQTTRCASCASKPKLEVRCDQGVLYDKTNGQALSAVKVANYPYQCQELACVRCPDIKGIGQLDELETITAYTQKTVGCGEKVADFKVTFVCKDGKLTKNGAAFIPDTKEYFNAIKDDCDGCRTDWGVYVPWGTKINHYKTGETSSSSGCGSCKSQERTCLNTGKFDGDAEFNQEKCKNESSCNQEGGGAPPRGCLLPWQNSFVTPGTSIPMWRKKIVNKPDSCANHFKLGVCQLSTGNFDAGLDYIYQACTEI